MCIAICQMLSTYMLNFHVCVYIVCICAGGRNVLKSLSYSSYLFVYVVILCYTCICHMLSTCMFAYHVCVLYVFVLEAR